MKGDRFKTAHIVTTAVFAVCILAFFALLIFLPKHEGELSSLEFRTLAVNPFKASGETLARQLVRGELSANVDTYLEDHFPARSFFIAVNSYTSRLAGRNAVQSVVQGRNGRLYDAALEIDRDKIGSNLARIESFAEELDVSAEIVIVPNAAVCVEDELPLLHPVYRDAEAIAFAAEHGKLKVYDLPAVYKRAVGAGEAESMASLFYRTDHHWTMEGAYVCYRTLCDAVVASPRDKGDFTVESYDFYGSFYRKAGLWLTKPDTLEVWRNDALDNASVTIGAGDTAVKHIGVYDEAQLAEGEIDRYAAYLYSNNGLTVIENEYGNGEAVMLIKDSYGNSIAPLLVCDYSTVIMIDTRYYSSSLPDPSEVARQYGVSRLIVVFGTESMVTESWLGYLR